MRRLLAHIAIVCISYTAIAQDTTAVIKKDTMLVVKQDTLHKRVLTLGISGGYTFLMGPLAGITFADPKSGYSSYEGYNVNAEATYWLKKGFGLGAMFSHSSFYAAQTGLANLAIGYQQTMIADSAHVLSINKYNFFNLFVGPYFSVPLKNKKIAIDIRAVGGLTYVNTPDIDIDVISSGIIRPFSQNSSAAFSYGFQGGVGIRYAFGEHFGIKLNVDYYYSNPNIKILNSNFPANSGREITNYHQPVTMLNFNFGFIYKLSKGSQSTAKY